jgi:hypothetical protein
MSYIFIYYRYNNQVNEKLEQNIKKMPHIFLHAEKNNTLHNNHFYDSLKNNINLYDKLIHFLEKNIKTSEFLKEKLWYELIYIFLRNDKYNIEEFIEYFQNQDNINKFNKALMTKEQIYIQNIYEIYYNILFHSAESFFKNKYKKLLHKNELSSKMHYDQAKELDINNAKNIEYNFI